MRKKADEANKRENAAKKEADEAIMAKTVAQQETEKVNGKIVKQRKANAALKQAAAEAAVMRDVIGKSLTDADNAAKMEVSDRMRKNVEELETLKTLDMEAAMVPRQYHSWVGSSQASKSATHPACSSAHPSIQAAAYTEVDPYPSQYAFDREQLELIHKHELELDQIEKKKLDEKHKSDLDSIRHAIVPPWLGDAKKGLRSLQMSDIAKKFVAKLQMIKEREH